MLSYKDKTIPEVVREMEEMDRTGNTKTSKYVTYDQRKILNTIDAYINSKHISGSTDSLGREKPFFNIVTAVRNIWYRATKITRKNIKVNATRAELMALSLVANVLLIRWMRKAKFAKYLNDWGRTLATYGSAVSEFVKQDGKLVCNVISWNKMICDPIDFDNNPKIKVMWLTPAQLRANKSYDQGLVEELLNTTTSRETIDQEQQDNKDNYIQVYEISGEFPKSFITEDEEDCDEYTDQMHVITYLSKKDAKNKFDDYTLFKGNKKPYMRIDHLIEEDGRTLAIGAVENSFEGQWMVNHTEKNIKDHLDIASKWLTQTADGGFADQNLLNDIEHGDILIHKPGMPITRVDNRADTGALQAFSNSWMQAVHEINNINESMTQAPKSGTAWRQTEAVLQEAHSLFETMVENKGVALEEIMQEEIIPYIKTKMDTGEEISEILEQHHIKKLDMMYVPNKAMKEANKRIRKDILNKTPEDLMNGNVIMPDQQEQIIANEAELLQNVMNEGGNQRFIVPSEVSDKTWKEVLKDFEWEVDVDVAGEGKDTMAILQSLTTLLQTLASSINPQTGESMLLQNEKTRLIVDKILEQTKAISPVELNNADLMMQAPQVVAQPQVQPQAPPIQ